MEMYLLTPGKKSKSSLCHKISGNLEIQRTLAMAMHFSLQVEVYIGVDCQVGKQIFKGLPDTK